MKYILIKTVKGTNCGHRVSVGEQVWSITLPQPILDLNMANRKAQEYNDEHLDCGCQCKIKEVE